MRKLIFTLALLCLGAMPEVFSQATSPASDDVVIVGNPAQPFMPNHRATIQEAIRKAGAFGVVIVPPGYPGAEDLTTLSNPNSVLIIDLRGGTFKTLPAISGGGGGGGCIGGSPTNLQFNDSGTCGGSNLLRFDKLTGSLFLPDGASWTPSGIFPANPSSNTAINFDSSAAQFHHVFFRSTIDGQVCLQGGGTGGNLVCVTGDTSGPNVPQTLVEASDAGFSHYIAMNIYPFAGGSVDQLGYAFTGGAVKFSTDLQGLPGCIFCIARSDKGVHMYGPLYLPNGSLASAGTTGAVPVSQGSGSPIKWSSDLTGTYYHVGSFGTCPAPTAGKSSICYGPSGHLQASWNGDAYQDLVRSTNIPASGISGTISPSQIDLTQPTGLAGFFEAINSVPQYNIPEGGATGQGLVASPIADAVDGIISSSEPWDFTTLAYGNDYPNCAATGTTANKLAKLSSSAGVSCAVITATTDTSGALGVSLGRTGTTGSAFVGQNGIAQLAIDGATTVNDYIQISGTVTGSGHDTGSTSCPGSGQAIGRVLSTNGGAGTYSVRLGSDCPQGSGGSGVGDPGGNGLMSRTALNTTVNRSVATADVTHVSVTNGDGVAGNPTLDTGSNVVLKTSANTYAAGATSDHSGQTGANSFKVPAQAGLTTTVNGAVAYDTTNDNLHTANAGADAILPVATTATPGNGNGVKWTKVGNTVKLGDTGALAVTPSSTTSFTNKNAIDVTNTLGVLNVQMPLAAVVGTAAVANVYAFTIPGNTLGSNGCFRATVFFKHTTGSASVTYSWAWGGTGLGNVVSNSGADGTSRIFVCNNASTGSQVHNREAVIFGTASTGGVNISTAAKDTTVNQDISFTFNVAATDQVTPEFFLVELIH